MIKIKINCITTLLSIAAVFCLSNCLWAEPTRTIPDTITTPPFIQQLFNTLYTATGIKHQVFFQVSTQSGSDFQPSTWTITLSTSDYNACEDIQTKGNYACIAGVLGHELGHAWQLEHGRPYGLANEIFSDFYSVALLDKVGIDPCGLGYWAHNKLKVDGDRYDSTHLPLSIREVKILEECNKKK